MKFLFNTRLLGLSIILFLAYNSQAQLIKEYKKYANIAYKQGDYKLAMEHYFEAYLKDSFDISLLYQYAESARMYQSYDNAKDGYERLIQVDAFEKYDLAYFWLAEINKVLGNYDLAYTYFSSFETLCKDKTSYPFYKTKNELVNKPIVYQILEDTNKSQFINHFDLGINSDYSELAPNLYSDKELYLTTLRLPDQTEEKNNEELAQHRFHVLKFDGNLGFWDKKEFRIPLEGKKYKYSHVGNYEKVSDKEAYFTVCKSASASALTCNIFVNKEDEPIRKLEGINHSGGTTTQPYVYIENGKTNIYFSSNRPGGYGGMDIWIAKLDKEGFVIKVQNCGDAINTAGDEMSPFYQADSNRLFFSSDWHPGLGGLDIFKADKMNDSTYANVSNVGIPINSGINELDFEWDSNQKKGYFASNRLGSFFVNGEYCCHDIYAVEVLSDSEIIAKNAVFRDYIEDYDLIEPNYEDSVKVDTPKVIKPNNFDRVYYEVTKSYIELRYPTIYFGFNSFKLNQLALNTLDSVISIVKRDSLDQIELAAHTDGKGSDIYNLRLSKKRATFVQSYLIENGIDSSYIKFGFYGEKEPIASNKFEDGSDNPEGRKLNRRVELRYYKEE